VKLCKYSKDPRATWSLLIGLEKSAKVANFAITILLEGYWTSWNVLLLVFLRLLSLEASDLVFLTT
jgi:hypothetical protein